MSTCGRTAACAWAMEDGTAGSQATGAIVRCVQPHFEHLGRYTGPLFRLTTTVCHLAQLSAARLGGP
jgi:hypothetical protein